MEKKIFKIWWLDSPDKDGNRTHQYTTKRDVDMISAIKAVVEFFGLDINDVFKVETL